MTFGELEEMLDARGHAAAMAAVASGAMETLSEEEAALTSGEDFVGVLAPASRCDAKGTRRRSRGVAGVCRAD